MTGSARAIGVCERLVIARKRRLLTQSEAGALLNPPRTHAAVSDIERGRTQLTLDLLAQFARIYGVGRGWLLLDWMGDEVPR